LQPLGSVIDSVLDSVGLTQRYNGAQVVSRWTEIVGDQIASRAKAVKYEAGTLYVVVEDSAWRQNLSMELENILAQIRKYPFGRAVTEIRLIANQRGK
jgi:predicted nucleic acid-binding Zn ribbon protein